MRWPCKPRTAVLVRLLAVDETRRRYVRETCAYPTMPTPNEIRTTSTNIAPSPMPFDFADQWNRSQLRDLVEFLAQLKEPLKSKDTSP